MLDFHPEEMTMQNGHAGERGQIRSLIDGWADAARRKDAKALVAGFAPLAIVFDLIEPLQYSGTETVQKRAEEWLASFEGPIDFQVENLSITSGHDVAFSHSLNRVCGTKTGGEKIDMWWRSTVCFQKTEGDWTVVHEHSSVPFDMTSGKASLELKP